MKTDNVGVDYCLGLVGATAGKIASDSWIIVLIAAFGPVVLKDICLPVVKGWHQDYKEYKARKLENKNTDKAQ